MSESDNSLPPPQVTGNAIPIVVVGVSHRSANVAVRERVAVAN